MANKVIGFITGEVVNLSVGYLAGLSASMLVSKYFVKKGIANLWGLTAKREALDRDSYEWLMFASSYLIGLIVMATVNYLIKRARNPKSVDAA